jgi:HK97 family phage portal protein
MSLFHRKTEARSANWDVLRGMDFAHDGHTFRASNTSAALSLIPVYAATALIADQFSALPFSAFEFTGGAARKMSPQPELTWNPHVHPMFTRVEWLHQFATSWLLRGNAYGVITALDSFGRPSKIAWLHPDGVKVDESYTRSDRVEYEYNGKPLDQTTLIHIPWYPAPGSVVGLSPVSHFRAVIETGGAAVNYGRNWFQSGARPSGHLKYGAGPLDPEASAEAKSRFKAAVAANDIFVSGNDWEWEALSIKPEEAQFLESIKATANQVAAIFRVNPEDIGGTPGSSLTYSTLELNQINFQTRTLLPIYTRLEHHLNRWLPDFQYIKFNPDAIVRADILTRMQAHEIGLRTYVETNGEARALEERPPLTDAEKKEATLLYGKSTPAPTAAPGTQPGQLKPKGGA